LLSRCWHSCNLQPGLPLGRPLKIRFCHLEFGHFACPRASDDLGIRREGLRLGSHLHCHEFR
jgi:hypothetical protein